MSDHVWIVSGETGSYEDHTEWTVAAFTSREEADALCKTLNAWCREHDVHPADRLRYGDNEWYRRVAALVKSGTSPDPFFDCDGSTTYSVAACALGGAHRDCATCRGRR